MSKVALQRKWCLVDWGMYNLARSSNFFDMRLCGKRKKWVEKHVTLGIRFSGCEGWEHVGMVAKSPWYSVIKEHFSSVAWKEKEETGKEWGWGQVFFSPSPANRFVVRTVSGNCTSLRVPGGGHILRCALIKWSGTMSQEKQLPEGGVIFAHVLTSATKQQQDSGLGGREVLVNLESSALSKWCHTPESCAEEKKSRSTSTLGNLGVRICSPKSVLHFLLSISFWGESLIGSKYWISNKCSLAISKPGRSYFIQSLHM